MLSLFLRGEVALRGKKQFFVKIRILEGEGVEEEDYGKWWKKSWLKRWENTYRISLLWTRSWDLCHPLWGWSVRNWSSWSRVQGLILSPDWCLFCLTRHFAKSELCRLCYPYWLLGSEEHPSTHSWWLSLRWRKCTAGDRLREAEKEQGLLYKL